MDTSLSLKSQQQRHHEQQQFQLQLRSLLQSQQQQTTYPPPSPSPDPWYSVQPIAASSPFPWQSNLSHDSPPTGPPFHASPDADSFSPSSFGISADGDSPPSFAPVAADEVLMDPVIEYITDMLMDENMEDRKCMQQECTSYQAIINGFYQDLQSSSPTDPQSEQDEDLQMIKEALFPDSPQPYINGESNDTNDLFSERDLVNQLHWILEPNNSSRSLDSFDSSSSATDLQPEEDEELKWIKDILVAQSPQPYTHEEPSEPNDVISEKTFVNQLLGLVETNNSVTGLSSSDVRSFDSSSPSGNSVSLYSQADSPTGVLEVGHHVESVNALASRKTEEPVSTSPINLPTLPILQEILESTNSVISQNGRRASERKSLAYKLQNRQQMKILPSMNGASGFEASASSLSEAAYANGRPAHFSYLQNGTALETKPITEKDKKDNTDAEKSEENTVSFVNNEYLRAECQAKMYGDWLPSKNNCLAKKNKASGISKSQKSNGSLEPVDLRALLVDCAQAFGSGNIRKANELIEELRRYATPDGTVSQRLAHYFTEGLVARLEGTGAQRFTAMSTNRPSAAVMLKAYRLMVEVCPFVKLSHYFANQNILKVAEGASRLHIVDYGILYGVQWPSLISALAERKGGPPFLRITGIEFPQPGVNPKERVEETGRRLSEYARAYNVPFQYNAIAKKWEDIKADDLDLQEGEVLVVNCILRLRHLMDETVLNPSPRRKVLSRIHSFNPDLMVIAVVNAGFNAPFFVSRFREALYHYSSKFDMIDTTVCENDNQMRALMERECMGRDILNVVACEGPERVERPETYRQWHTRFERAGFECVPLDQSMFSKAKHVIRACYHKDYTIDTDSKWMLLGWKGRINEGLSAWKPTRTIS